MSSPLSASSAPSSRTTSSSPISSATEVPTTNQKQCSNSSCSAIIVGISQWKQCERCREKGRESSKRKKERKDEAARKKRAALSYPGSSNIKEEDRDGGEDDGEDSKSVVLVQDQAGVKRKYRESVAEEPDDWLHAKKRMRLAFGDIFTSRKLNSVSAEAHPPTATPRSSSNEIQFQTSTKMYGKLNAQLVSKSKPFYKLNTTYTFSVMPQPQTGHAGRAEIVFKALKTLVALERISSDVSEVDPTYPAQINSLCGCSQLLSSTSSSSTTSPDPVAPTKSSTKRKQADLSRWILKSTKSSSSSPKVTAPPCGGTVCIKVGDDYSHPIDGIVGQRVTVEVRHGGVPVSE